MYSFISFVFIFYLHSVFGFVLLPRRLNERKRGMKSEKETRGEGEEGAQRKDRRKGRKEG